MRTLVLGGIRSGKSRWAEESLAGAEPVTYIATGTGRDDADWTARINTHRARRPADWRTVESSDVAAGLRGSSGPTLVDDIGNYLTAAMDRNGAWEHGSAVVADQLDALLDAVRAFDAPLALVSPEVGLTVIPDTAAGRLFADVLGTLNQRLAAACDRVVLVVAGIPVQLKPVGVR